MNIQEEEEEEEEREREEVSLSLYKFSIKRKTFRLSHISIRLLLPLKTLLKQPTFIGVLGKLGDNWNVQQHLFDGLERFVCAMYGGNTNIAKVDDLRLSKMQKLMLCTKEGRCTLSEEP